MGLKTVITAPTMAQALAKVRQELGSDALILDHEESNGKVSITALSDKVETQKTDIPSWIRPLSPPSKLRDDSSDTSRSNKSSTTSEQIKSSEAYNDGANEHRQSQVDIPTRRSDFKKFVDSNSSFDETLTAISAICDLSEFHQLGDVLGEAWLQEMNPEFTHSPIQLAPALDRIMPTDPMWLDKLSSKGQVVLVGPPGSGKTVTLAKLAAMLMERGKKVRVVTLDVLKASGTWQLEEYLKPLSLKIYVGFDYLPDTRPKEIILIDTPALNINLAQDQHYLKVLKTKVNVPYTLVLPADMNPLEAEDLAEIYAKLNTETLIVTRLELSRRCGVLLRAASQGLKLVLTSKGPELIEGLQCVTPESILEKMLNAREITP